MTDDGDRKHAAAVVRHLTAMARQRRAEHEAVVRDLGFASLVEKCRNGGKVSTKEFLQVLAVAKRSREAFYPDDPNVKIPADLIDAIAIALAGKGGWLRAQKELQEANEKKRSKADRLGEEVRRAADRLRAENPGIGASDIEKALAKTYSCSVRTIRRHITKG